MEKDFDLKEIMKNLPFKDHPVHMCFNKAEKELLLFIISLVSK